MRARAVRRIVPPILLGCAVACGGSSSSPTQPSGTLQSLVIQNSEALEVDTTVQMSAIGHYSDSTTRDLTSQATWSTSDPQVATIEADGKATGHAPGEVTIQAAYQGVTVSQPFSVLGHAWNVHLTVTSVQCLADCDGLGLGKGDFQFDIKLDAGVLETQWSSPNRVELGDGDIYDITDFLLDTRQDPEAQFTLRDQPASYLNLTFEATEWDHDLFAGDVADSRMANRHATAAYKYAANKNWLPSGSNYITLGSGGCRIRMHYAITKS
jgi:hypothetical protein